MHFASSLKSVVASTSQDLKTCAIIFKNGWPADNNQKNEIILAAIRILSVRMITGATIIAFSAIYINGFTIIHKIFAVFVLTVIIFHDIYVASSRISKSLATHQFTSANQINSKRVKLITETNLVGTGNFARELTRGMWVLDWILIKTSGYWVESIAQHFFNKK